MTDDSAFEALYQAQHEELLRYALRRVGRPEDAADAVAETWMVAWRRRQDLHSSSWDQTGRDLFASRIDALSKGQISGVRDDVASNCARNTLHARRASALAGTGGSVG